MKFIYLIGIGLLLSITANNLAYVPPDDVIELIQIVKSEPKAYGSGGTGASGTLTITGDVGTILTTIPSNIKTITLPTCYQYDAVGNCSVR